MQYGLSYINARGSESEIYWHGTTPLGPNVGAGGKKEVPTGATETVPKPIDDLSKHLDSGAYRTEVGNEASAEVDTDVF